MLKPAPLHVGDHVAVVSLSSGTLGELTQQHQLNRGLKRMRQLGLVPVMMPNALKGRLILQQRPELRAADLKAAFLDPSIRGVVAAIGGDDTYRTVPFLMADEQFKTAVRRSPKLFTGFSDTTINHLMFYQLGLQTFYGPNFLSDLAELGRRCCRIPRRLGSVTLKILSRQALLAVPCGMTNEQISVNRRREHGA